MSIVAQAEEQVPVSLDMSGCLTIEEEDLRRLVSLEIAPRLRLATANDAANIRATLTCDDDRARIEVVTGEGDLPLEMDIDFDRVSRASRTRLLALAVAELIATSELERSEPKRKGEPPPVQPSPREQPSEPRVSGRRWGGWLGPGISSLGQPRALLYGADVGAFGDLGPVTVLGDVQGRFGRKAAGDDVIQMSLVSAFVGLSPRLVLDPFHLTVGPGLRVGWAHLVGRSDRDGVEGRSLSGLWFGPAGAARLTWRVGASVGVHGGVEFGYVTRAVRGFDETSRSLLAVEGVWTSALIGLSVVDGWAIKPAE